MQRQLVGFLVLFHIWETSFRGDCKKQGAIIPLGFTHWAFAWTPSFALYIYWSVVDFWAISCKHLVGSQALAHPGNNLRNWHTGTNSFFISVAGGGPCPARAYSLRQLCERS